MLCPNCGSERLGRFCPRCGQNDRDYQRSLPPLLRELLKETFEVDSRLWTTLKLLIFKPGELALEFSRNRRASYVSPIRLYLFVSIAFFFLLSMTTDVAEPEDAEAVRVEAEGMKETDTSRLLALLPPDRQQRAREILARPETSSARILLLQVAGSVGDDTAGSRVETFLIGRLVDALHEPESIARQFMDNMAIGIFVMLPVYAVLLKLFYFRAQRYYVEHLVFATQLHTFTFVIFGAQLLLPTGTGTGWIDSLVAQVSTGLMLWVTVYHYLALRRYFGEGRIRTFLKFSVLMLFYSVLLLPTALVIVFAVTVLSL
ncbi:MAG: DUF3667 domain-containing protein [Pseudomonadales bacterium]